MSETRLLAVDVWRQDAGPGGFKRYRVPRHDNQTVLDVVTWIQRHLDLGLSYRFACRVGMCGSCAMTVNGRPRWTCRTHVQKVCDRGVLTIAPLRNMPVIKDLVCDMAAFFDKWERAKGRFVGGATRNQPIAAIRPDSARRQAADQGIECINCGICYAACDVVGADPDYLGPAALNRAWTLVNDVRDQAGADRLRAVAGAGGCYRCHAQSGCSAHCPNALDPTAAIAGLKRAATRAAVRGRG